MRRNTYALVGLFVLCALLGAGCSTTEVHNPTGTTTVKGAPGFQSTVTANVKPLP